jgi:YaiO family outer membrane protein
LHGTEVMLSADYRTWREILPSWREAHLALRQNTSIGVGIARFSHVRRGELRDEKIELEAYPAFRRGYLALGAGLAPRATIYPSSTLTAELFATVMQRVEASAGYRRMSFDSPVDVLTGSVGVYYGNLLFGARVNHVLHDGSSVLLSARRYLSDDGQYVGVVATTGSAPVLINAPADFESRFNRSIGAEALFFLSRRWVLTAQWSVGRDGLLGGGSANVAAGQLGVGVRF